MITSIVVFDSRVPDLAQLRDGLVPGTRSYVLDQARDGVRQIAEILARDGLTDLTDLSLVAHGRPGGIAIGATYLDGDNLPRYAARLAEIGAALAADGSVRLYACDVAFGPRGRAFVDDLARVLGVDVAAAAHGVGSAELGGDWSLDVATGAPTQPPFTPAAMERYAGLLTPVNTAPLFRVDGTGKVLNPVGADQSDDQGQSVTLLPNGKILVAGSGRSGADTDFALVRYNADGSLDTTFGTGGKVLTPIGGSGSNDSGQSVIVDGSGNILVAGYGYSNGSGDDFALARFTADGALDEDFGTSGVVVTPIGAGSGADQGYGVSLQNGKIIVAGFGTGSGGYDFAVVRYNTDGTLDTDFGMAGKVLTPVGAGQSIDIAFGMSVDSYGRIVLAGTSEDNGTSSLAVVRYTINGVLDTTFGNGGKILTPVDAGGFFGTSVSVDANNRIIVAGYGAGSRGDADFVVARYNADGSADSSFGDIVAGTETDARTGKVITAIGAESPDLGTNVTLQTDGKIVVSGYSYNGDGGYDFALVRYNSDGSLDTDFGTGGKVVTPVGADTSTDLGRSVRVQADGKIVVVGSGDASFDEGGSGTDFAVVRYNSDGSLDTDFGSRSQLDGTAAFTEGGASVKLAPDVKLEDAELDARNGGLGDYAGASLTITRTDGADAEDVFGFATSSAFTVDGNVLKVPGPDGDTFATFTTTGGTLVVSFTGTGVATSARADAVARSVTYANDSDAPPHEVSLDWSFSDGGPDAQTVTGLTTVAITAVNDAPTATNLSASETYTKNTELDLTDIVVKDVDSDSVTATLTLSNAAAGSLSSTGTEASYDAATGIWSITGTVAAVNAALADVTFKPAQNFTETFTIASSISDDGGQQATGSKTFTHSGGNTAPTVQNNTNPTLTEGGTATITSAQLAFADVEQDAAAITYTVSSVSHGTLRLNGTAVGSGGSFTQDDIDHDRVSFVHDGSETGSAGFGFSVSDGEGGSVTGQSFAFGITASNDAPTLQNNTNPTLTEGGTATITSAQLAFADVEQDAAAITYTVSSVSHGTLRLNGTAVGSGGSFTQDDIDHDRVSFVHDGSETGSAGFGFSVSDGEGGSVTGQSFAFGITASNDAPTLQNNTNPTLTEGGTATITSAQLAFADVEQDAAAITYTVSSVSHGTLRLNGTAVGSGGSFTQDDIDHDRVSFVHDGSETGSAGFGFSVSDGEGGSVTGQSFAFGVTASNDAPTLFVKGVIDVLQGGTTPLTTFDLFAKDIDSPSDDLTYSVSETIHGKIIVDGKAATTFTQAQLAADLVGFRQDGSRNETASFTVTVSDGSLASSPKTVTANVDLVPVVTDIAYGTHDGTLRAGESVQFLVSLSEAVTVNGIPSLTLSDGGTAHYIPGSSPTKLLFSHTIAPGQTSADLAVTGLSFTDGTIRDAAGQNLAALPTGGIDPDGTLVVDGVAPTLTIHSDASQLRAGERATISFTFSEKPGTPFTADDIVVTGGTLSALSGTGLTRTAIFTPTAGVNGGTASITVAAGSYADAAGNPGKAGTSPTLTFDTTADAARRATLSVDGTGDGVINAAEATAVAFAVAGLDRDAHAVATFTGGSLSRSVTVTADGGGTVDLSGFTGIVSSRLSITDKAGNSAGVAGNSVRVDTAAPGTPTGLSLAAGSDGGTPGDGLTNDATPTITGRAEAGSLITLYRGTTVLGSAHADATGSFSITASPLAEGRQSLTVRAIDAAGNPGAASASLSLTIDTTAPAAPTIRLTHDTGASASDGITSDPAFAVGAAEAGGTLLYKLDGATVFGTTKPVFATDGSDDGAHTITVAQQDAAGTLGATATMSFTLDTIAPRIAIERVEGATNVVGHTIAGGADVAGLVTVTHAGAVFGTAATGADGAWELPYVFRGDGPQVGYGFAAAQTDLAGNVGSDSFDFALDFTPNRDLFGDVITDAGSAAGQVYTLFDGLLARAPDASGLGSFVPALETGGSLHDVAQAILSSAEFTARFGDVTRTSDAAFVGELYQIALGRGADAAGEQAWLASLADGTSRADVAVSFAFSAENQAQIASALRSGVFVPDAVETDVARLYYGLLDRAPDAGGLRAFSDSAKAGHALTEIAQEILISPEYGSLHPGDQSDAHYVASLYQGALGRTTDAGGEQHWLDVLAQGSSRAEVAVGIAESVEAHQHLVGKIEAGWHLS